MHNTFPINPLAPRAALRRLAAAAAGLFACALSFATPAAHAQSLTFSSSAGYAGQGSSNGAGSNAQFYLPAGTAVDNAGNVYVADSGNNTIRIITSGGVVSTLAGSPGVTGSLNGPGTNALFNQPQGVAVDAAGNIYVADTANDTIRKISGGVVTTLAGSVGVAGSNNATGPGASFNLPVAIALDGATNLYVADYGNNAIRKVTPGGAVSTFAGLPGTNGSVNANGTNALFYQPQGIAVDAAGNVYVSDTANATIRKITSGGTVTTFAGTVGTNGSVNATGTNAQFYTPLGIGIDSATNLYVADSFNDTIRKITPAGVVTTFAGGVGTNGSADGPTNQARFWGPNGVAVDGAGNLYVGDYYNGTIRKVTSAGLVSTFAGSPSAGSVDGTNASARFNFPLGAAVDTLGNVYIADSANSTIRKITPAGQAITFAGSPGVTGSADGATNNALFNSPEAVATDSANNIYVADTGNHTIRKITSGGTVSTLAGLAGTSGNADGSGAGAQFFRPQGIVVDPSGNIYVSDTGNNTIRKIASGVVTTLAGNSIANPGSTDGTGTTALFNTPKGLALDSATNLYIADCLNHTIRQLTPGGVSSTIAGWPGIYGSADGTNNGGLFFEPSDVAVDVSGNIFVADTGNHTIRKITPSGTNWVVSTVGGLAGAPGSGNGTGNAARFDFPAGIALDSFGGVYVADSANNTIRLDATVIVPMQISNVAVSARRNSAIFTWNTSVNGNAQILYGTTPAYGLTLFDSTLTNSHAELLVGLVTNTIYYYAIISAQGGNAATNTGTFSTDNTIILTAQMAPPLLNYTGVWINDSTGADRFTSTYKHASTVVGTDTAQATFRPNIVLPANYDTFVWYSEGPDRSAAAPATVSYQGGSLSTTINETVPGGSWLLLAGNEPYATGTNGFLRLGNGSGETGKIVIADAARWTYSAGQDLPSNGNVPAWWAQFYFGTTAINSSFAAANGLSILSDYILGISPLDPNTTLNFSFNKSTNGFQAVFSPYYVGGRLYQLQSATNLINPVWTNVPNMIATTNNSGQGIFNCTNLSGAQTFYRLSVQLTP